MNSILDRFIDGKFEYETGSLDISCPKIELSVKKNENTEGQFTVTAMGAARAEGYVLSTHLRMNSVSRTFAGKEQTIRYVFSSMGMEEGEMLRGEFHIISNLGEYYIPYVITVEHQTLESSLGSIKNLFHFANLAKTNWDEAVKLFYRREFASILNGADRQYYEVYEGLSGIYGNEQNVDEFLICINKKQKTEYIPMENLIRVDAPVGVSEGKATITRNGWGYTWLTVETDGDFLSVEKEKLTDDDFLGNICSFSYHIDAAGLHSGNNYGQIVISNPHFSTSIQFIVTCSQYKSLFQGNKRKMRELNLQLMQLYCKFRVRKITGAAWLKETSAVVDQMCEQDEKSITVRLFKAQLLITEERYNEAKWVLDMIEGELIPGRSDPAVWCYYLYLTTLYNREEGYVNEITEEVENIYLQNMGNWRIAWLLLYLREEFTKEPAKKWAFLEQQFIQNCKSPILYVEAVILMNQNPTLLNQLSEYEIQVLNYAAKNGLLTRDVIIQVQYLMTKIKEYSGRLFYILQKCYEVSENDELLASICVMLMRGNKISPEYFPWYQKAVAKELRITRLYEFYMMSLPADYAQELPKMVMMYFAYNSELDYTRKAVLYANILKYQEVYSEIAASYRETIDIFMVEQIKKGHINKELAYLYRNAMTPLALRPDYAEHLVPLLFTNQITVENENIKSVVVVYEKVMGEMVYPLNDARIAYVPIYSNEYALLFQDAKGNRYAADVTYRIEKLLIPGKHIKEFGENTPPVLGLDLYLCEDTRNGVLITDKNAASYRRLCESERISEEYRREIRLKLVCYYMEADLPANADSLLAVTQPVSLNARERADYVQCMVARGMLDQAFEWVTSYGVERIDHYTLLRLCSRILVRTEFEQNETMTKVVFQSFKSGKYDENVVKYLVAYYEGLTKDMRDIWKAAQGFQIDTHEICEKMILQMLFCNSYVGQKDVIFREYAENGGRLLVEMAYLTENAYEYFVKDKIVEDTVFLYLTRLFYRGEQFHKVCKYAYLKYYTENKDKIDESILHLLAQFAAECMEEHVCFPFFQVLSSEVPLLKKLSDRTFIEYRADPKASVNIHYVLQHDEANSGEYCKEPMVNMYEGIFVKSFTLFFGEKLQYYITEDINGNEQLTASEVISKSEIVQNDRPTKFYMINDMMIAKTLQEYQTVDQLAREYMEQDYMVKELFTLLS